MSQKKLYDNYHKGRKLPKRIISSKNFTYRSILPVLDKYAKGNILVIGSGVGSLDFYLAKKGFKTLGVEYAKEAFEISEKSAKIFRLEKQAKFINKDFLKFETNKKFNFILCSEVLEHLKDEKKALKKIHKMLEKDGKIMITVPSLNAPLYCLGMLEKFDEEVGHERRYNLDSLIKVLDENAFSVIYSEKTESLLRNFLFTFHIDFPIRVANKFDFVADVITFLDKILLKFTPESQLIVVAEKRKN